MLSTRWLPVASNFPCILALACLQHPLTLLPRAPLQVPGNRGEFIAYGLLFALTAGQGSMLVSELMATTAQEDLQHPSVEHALGVCR